MVATYCLMTCALAMSQPSDRPDWQPGPRLTLGQELVYRGSISEESLGRGVQFSRTYRLESRAFVLAETANKVQEVAFLTQLRLKGAGEVGKEPEPCSVRLDIVRFDAQGKIAADSGSSSAVPLEGPATFECGAILEHPRARLTIGQTWDIADGNRPRIKFKALGSEILNGTSCLKVEGIQQSPDWDNPRADQTSWRRHEVIWLSSRLGAAFRVERTIERREPARQEPTQRVVTRYELESSLQYPGQLSEERRREILLAKALSDTAGPLLPNPGVHGPKPFDAVLAKIAAHVENCPPTPYREAVLLMKRRVEAARRGEAPAVLQADNGASGVSPVALLDQPAPDFVANNLLNKESVRLRRLKGQPVLLVFFHPASVTATEVLRFAQSVNEAGAGRIHVLGMATADDEEPIRKQWADLRLSFPIVSGKGLRHMFRVEATPKLMVLDADGVLRAAYEGWGVETPLGISQELRRLAKPGTGSGAAADNRP